MSGKSTGVPGAVLEKGLSSEGASPVEGVHGERGTVDRASSRRAPYGRGPGGRGLVTGRAAEPDPVDAGPVGHDASGPGNRDGVVPSGVAASADGVLAERSADARIAIHIRGVDLLFGPRAARRVALEALDAGCDRETILERTGVVLAVADASLVVPTGSLSVLTGLSGSGKSSLLRCVNGLNPLTRGSLTVRSGGGRAVELAGLRGKELRAIRRRALGGRGQRRSAGSRTRSPGECIEPSGDRGRRGGAARRNDPPRRYPQGAGRPPR